MPGLKNKVIKQSCLFLACLFFYPGLAQASAGLFFSPNSNHYLAGDVFAIDVFVASPVQAMNAVSGNISFQPEKLEVVSVSSQNSVMSFWVIEPAFNNQTGTVSFEGLVLNPGFQGPAGKIISVLFKGKSAGSAEIHFSSGSVLANDGLGSNIVTGLGTANYVLKQAVNPIKLPSAKPEIPLVGTDVLPPEVPTILHQSGQVFASRQPQIYFVSTDAGSGLDYFEVTIDDGEKMVWRPDGSRPFETPELNPGPHIMNIKAYDRAGNFSQANYGFIVAGQLDVAVSGETGKQNYFTMPNLLLAGAGLFLLLLIIALLKFIFRTKN